MSNAIKPRERKPQLNISLPSREMSELVINLASLMDGEKITNLSQAVAEAAKIANKWRDHDRTEK